MILMNISLALDLCLLSPFTALLNFAEHIKGVVKKRLFSTVCIFDLKVTSDTVITLPFIRHPV